ncbi:hypothetical protein ACJEIK_08425 [Mycobacterium sp. SMC-16]|uniref:hypothetical protein n=1 Tax=Mycobacteriaceae TaxID=1762 RepID=UPI000AAA5130|nr:hypothetical protein [Mycolicibacterium mucogenicum]
MNQTHTAAMHFGIVTARPALTHWRTEVDSVVSAVARWMSNPPATEPTSRAAYHSYLEHACMAREMDRL